MDTWVTILAAMGGNAAAIAVLGWLARSLVTQQMAKDLRQLESRLETQAATAIEQLKHNLQTQSVEHEIRFSRWHERQAAVIARLYALLVEAYWDMGAFVSPVDWANDPPKSDKYRVAMNKAAEFYRYFDRRRLFLPSHVADRIDKLVTAMRHRMIEFGVYFLDEQPIPKEVLRERHEVWGKTYDFFTTEMVVMRRELEGALQDVLQARRPAVESASDNSQT